MRALGDEPAIAAEQEFRETALVEQKNRLLPGIQHRAQLLLQTARKHGAMPTAELARHVDDLDTRKGLPVGALRQPDERPVLPFVAVVQMLDARRGRAQHQRAATAAHHPLRHLARVIARSLVLLVRAFVRFVHHDKADVRKRREKRAASAHDHPCTASPYDVPLVEPFALAHAGMHDRDDVAETPAEPGYRLRCEGDLGHKHESALSCLKRSLDGL